MPVDDELPPVVVPPVDVPPVAEDDEPPDDDEAPVAGSVPETSSVALELVLVRPPVAPAEEPRPTPPVADVSLLAAPGRPPSVSPVEEEPLAGSSVDEDSVDEDSLVDPASAVRVRERAPSVSSSLLVGESVSDAAAPPSASAEVPAVERAEDDEVVSVEWVPAGLPLVRPAGVPVVRPASVPVVCPAAVPVDWPAAVPLVRSVAP